MRATKVAILVVGLLCLGGAIAEGRGRPAPGASAREAEGRRHARKANHLADINKCKLAIPEYTRALHLMKDPTLLFNRGECYRRTGDTAKALADYRKFLSDLPAAPNRAQVENQIAALDRRSPPPASKAPPSRSGPAKPALPPPPVVAAVPSRTPAPPPAPEPPSAPSLDRAPALMPAPDRAPEPIIAERTPSDTEALRPPPRAPAPAEPEAPMALVGTKDRPAPAVDGDGGSSHWWLWALGAVVIAGGAAGTYFALKQGTTEIPSSALGNYKF